MSIDLDSAKRFYDFLEKAMGGNGFEMEDVEQICRAYFADTPALIKEVERLRDFMEGRKMLRTACPGCGDIVNFAQVALERDDDK